jgi:hypothetical protein
MLYFLKSAPKADYAECFFLSIRGKTKKADANCSLGRDIGCI